jgi:molecular chaperone DnaK (HSP70)
MPLLQDWLLQYFTTEQIFCHNPLTAVALGSLKVLQGQQVSDYIYHSYGVRYWNRRQNCHSWHTIIKAGQPYPMTEPVELTLGASLDNQPSIELLIGELGAHSGATEVYFDGDRLSTRLVTAANPVVQTLNDGPGASTIAWLEPPGKPGGDRLKVQFWVDENRYLRLTVTDLLTEQILLNNQQVAQLS